MDPLFYKSTLQQINMDIYINILHVVVDVYW